MFNFLKRFSGKKQAEPENVSPVTAKPGPVPAETPRRAPAAQRRSGEVLELPLDSVVRRLPEIWQSKVSRPGKATLRVPIERILEQLPSGAVKLSLLEFQEFSGGRWFDGQDLETTAVDLPLSEILSQLKPAQYQRRSNQRRVEVSDEISPLFGPSGAPLEPTRHIAPPAPARPVPPPPAPVTLPPREAQLPTTGRAVPAAVAASSAAPSIKVHPSAAAPAVALGAKPMEAVILSLAAVASHFPAEIQSALAGVNVEAAQLTVPLDDLEPGMRRGKLVFPWHQVRSWIRPPVSGPPDRSSEVAVELPLAVIAPKFVALRKPAMPQKKLAVSEAIPGIFAGGRPAPAPAPSTAPSPAPIVPAPAAPSLAASPAPVAAPATPAPSPAASSLKMRLEEPRPAAAPVRPAAPAVPAAKPAATLTKPTLSFGEIFGQPSKSNWTLPEVVQSATQLKSVSAALLMTTDGLLVAGHSSNSLPMETVAGFAVDLFHRSIQCSQQLKLPPPQHVTVSFDNVPLQIFQAGKIYFAALGRPGENLPKLQLSAIAAQLERQSPTS